MMRGIKKLDVAEMSLVRAIGCVVCGIAFFFLVKDARLAAVSSFEAFLFVAMIICNNILGDICLYFSIHMLGIAAGSAISSSYPIWVAIVSYMIYDAPLTPTIIAGTFLVVAGVGLLCCSGGRECPISFKGLACAVAASVFWATGLLLNKQLLVCGLNPFMIVLGRGVSFFGTSLILWFFYEFFVTKKAHVFRAFLKKDTILGLFAGACSLAFGGLFYLMALQKVPLTVATPICAANPVLASFFSMIVYKDRITSIQWAGIFLAVGGSILVTI